jgi:hypothetical protein
MEKSKFVVSKPLVRGGDRDRVAIAIASFHPLILHKVQHMVPDKCRYVVKYWDSVVVYVARAPPQTL